MAEQKLTKKILKSYIPKKYYDGSRENGICLDEDTYDLFGGGKRNELCLRTSLDNKLIKILRKSFKVEYVRHYAFHYHEYKVSIKNLLHGK